MNTDVYLQGVSCHLPRLMSLMDREPLSKTYGACDRTYWGWKFTDFPGARFQETLYAMSWMYATPFDGNRMFHDPKVMKWIQAGLVYWQSLQYEDGSFDEAYPYERSLAATAFTCFYLGEAVLKLNEHLPEDVRAALTNTFAKAGDWLCENDEHHGVLSNHLAAAGAALVVIGKITGGVRFHDRAQYFVDRILSKQSTEGWYEEYGGADFGYQTHGSFYLARIWQHTKDDELLDSLKRSIVFLSHFVHPNGTLGGEYGSRNTSFFFPAAFEMLAGESEEARAIARFMRESVANQDAAGLGAVDPYNFCPLLNNYLFAQDAAGVLKEGPLLPFRRPGRHDFPHAGLSVVVTGSYQAVFAPSKGGVVKIYDLNNRSQAVSDSGYWAITRDGSRVSSQSFSLDNEFSFEQGRSSVRAPFVRVNQKVMNPFMFLGFRVFSLSIGRSASIGRALKNVLVKVLVSRRKTLDVILEREVAFLEDEVTIRDRLHSANDELFQSLKLGTKFSSIHMGSSRYFQFDELEPVDIDGDAELPREFSWKAGQ